MSHELETAHRYRTHAEELRVVAANKASQVNCKALIQIATGYEMMANILEAIDKTNTAVNHER